MPSLENWDGGLKTFYGYTHVHVCNMYVISAIRTCTFLHVLTYSQKHASQPPRSLCTERRYECLCVNYTQGIYGVGGGKRLTVMMKGTVASL